MKNEIFNFNKNEVNVFINDNNEPLFIAKDICDTIGLDNVSKALYNLDDDEKLTLPIVRAGQNRQVNVITESGLYSLVLRSNKPEAKAFKKWITSEVLPSIRKHGVYMTDNKLEEVLMNPDLLIGLASELKKERAEKERLQNTTELQQRALIESAPKVHYFNEVLQSESTYATTLIAKELGMSAIDLNRKLNVLGVQFKQNDTWVLYNKYQDKGYTKTKTSTYTDTSGITKTSMLTVWTEKGRLFIHNLIKEKISA